MDSKVRIIDLIELERCLQDFRTETALSYGWWFFDGAQSEVDIARIADQPFPLTARAVDKFYKRFRQALGSCGEDKGGGGRSVLPEWLAKDPETRLEGLDAFMENIVKLKGEQNLMMQPALLKVLKEYAEWAIEDIQGQIDTALEDELENQN